MEIRSYRETDIPSMVRVWNEVVEEGVAFPQLDFLDEESGRAFFAAQTYCAVAEDDWKRRAEKRLQAMQTANDEKEAVWRLLNQKKRGASLLGTLRLTAKKPGLPRKARRGKAGHRLP